MTRYRAHVLIGADVLTSDSELMDRVVGADIRERSDGQCFATLENGLTLFPQAFEIIERDDDRAEEII